MTNAESNPNSNDPQDTNLAAGTNPHPVPESAVTSQPDDLHDLFSAPSDDSEDPLAGLRNDPNYAALIRDLEYIAKEVKSLFDAEQESPRDELWDQIKSKLASGDPEEAGSL